ncbi:MAG: alpha/beta hydrolase [Candidatus Micrarchaeota archaeon]|nr:alpha/beta hydrolase [Candidatus Micrarchaeota archaeon]
MRRSMIAGAVVVALLLFGAVSYLALNSGGHFSANKSSTTIPIRNRSTNSTTLQTTISATTTVTQSTTDSQTIASLHSSSLMVPWTYLNGNYTYQNQTYCTYGNINLHLDLYANAPLNASSQPRPIVVFIHGGGLIMGDKSPMGSDAPVFADISAGLIRHGSIVASLNYLLAPAYKYPNQSDDALCAIRFLRYYAPSFGGDPNKIGVFGDSSGGQLASVVGLTNGTIGWENEEGLKIQGASLTNAQYLNISSRPQAVGDFFGSINNTLPPGMSAQQAQQYSPQGYQNLVDVYNFNSTLMAEGSPSQYVTAGEPPFIIFQGNNDTQVPQSVSLGLYRSLKANGDNATLVIVNNSGHRFVPTPSGSQLHPGLGQIANQTLSFFGQVLGLSALGSISTSQGSAAASSSQTSSSQAPLNPADFIVATPVNLTQISQISKFRSCMGHDYSGYDVQGYQETQRSMKHYFIPLSQLVGTTSQIEEFAPFNGTVQSVVTEQTPVGKQVWIGYTQSGPQGGYPVPGIWNAVFFHLNPLPGITAGTHVSAGELIGYANLTAPIQEFDIALEEYNGSVGTYHQVLDSIFNHMSGAVLANFSAHGVQASQMVIPKAYRDANPCNFNVFNPNDSVTLS